MIITGASSGIGRELARQYAKRRCKLYSDTLVLAARKLNELETVADECRSLGASQVLAVVTDVTIEEDCRRLVQSCMDTFHRLDLLVLCAGVSAYQLFAEAKDLRAYKALIETNYYGYLHCAFYAMPHLISSSGQVLVISSISGEIGLPYRSAYCASKFAVTGFFEALRSEISDKVAITIVCPPSVRTNLRANSLINSNTSDNEDRINVEDCVQQILDSADRRARKVRATQIYFPFKVFIAAYFRPFFPDLIDRRLKQAARL